MATPTAAYGAMLAGVDYVLMGAGIPRDIPALLDRLAIHDAVRLPVDVAGDRRRVRRRARPARAARRRPAPAGAPGVPGDRVRARARGLPGARRAHPTGRVRHRGPARRRPQRAAARSADPRRPRPAGLRAPRRRRPRQGRRTRVCRSGWPAPYGTPERLCRRTRGRARPVCRSARCSRCARSPGSRPTCARELLAELATGTLDVRTDAVASPTGFPFKVVQLPGTLSDPAARATPGHDCATSATCARRTCATGGDDRLPLPGRARAHLSCARAAPSRTPSAGPACATA